MNIIPKYTANKLVETFLVSLYVSPTCSDESFGYTANVLVAKTATLGCVVCPSALQMHF